MVLKLSMNISLLISLHQSDNDFKVLSSLGLILIVLSITLKESNIA